MIGNCLTRDIRAYIETETLAGLGREAIALITAMREWGWRAVDSDVKVEQWGLRTGIDLLAKARDGTLILIELKTGSKQVFVANTASHCKRPFDFIDSFPLNRALVQALLTKHCAVADGKVGPNTEVAVIQVDKADVSLFTAKSRNWYERFESMGSKIVNMIIASRNKLQVERDRERQMALEEASRQPDGNAPGRRKRKQAAEDRPESPVVWTEIARRARKQKRRKASERDAEDATPQRKPRSRRSTPSGRPSKKRNGSTDKPSRRDST